MKLILNGNVVCQIIVSCHLFFSMIVINNQFISVFQNLRSTIYYIRASITHFSKK